MSEDASVVSETPSSSVPEEYRQTSSACLCLICSTARLPTAHPLYSTSTHTNRWVQLSPVEIMFWITKTSDAGNTVGSSPAVACGKNLSPINASGIVNSGRISTRLSIVSKVSSLAVFKSNSVVRLMLIFFFIDNDSIVRCAVNSRERHTIGWRKKGYRQPREDTHPLPYSQSINFDRRCYAFRKAFLISFVSTHTPFHAPCPTDPLTPIL